MDLALKDVEQNIGRFVATIAGLSLLFAIVFIMNGIYRGNIAEGVWLINYAKADLWVVQRDRGGPFNEQSTLPQALYHSIASVPGVKAADPIIMYGVQRTIAGTSRQFSIVGYDVFGGKGGPDRIVAGRPIRQAGYEMVADKKLGLRVGERVRLGVEDYTVVGLTAGTFDSGGNPVVFLSLPDAQQVLFQEDPQAIIRDRAASVQLLESEGYAPAQAQKLVPILTNPAQNINAVLVTLEPGADAPRVMANIRRWLYLNVYTTAQEDRMVLGGRMSKMNMTLGLFRSLLMIVSIIVIALLVYVLTMQKIKSIATLKLLGAGNLIIIRLIMEQSLVLAVASFIIGYVLVTATKDHFPRTLLLLPSDTLVTFLVLLFGGIVASLFGIRQALLTPPSLALEG